MFELGVVCLQADAGQIANCPNFWTAREDIEAGNCSTAAEEAVRHLYRTCLQGRLPQSWAGAEWWVQSYEGGRGLAFHFDKVWRACSGAVSVGNTKRSTSGVMSKAGLAVV